MDVQRFYKALDYLVEDEDNFQIQGKLQAVSSALKVLATNPAEQTYQVALSRGLEDLRKHVVEMIETYNPTQLDLIYEIGAQPFFSLALVNSVERVIFNNPMTPATARDFVINYVDDREKFINRVRETHTYFQEFGIDQDEPESGKAEIGFEIPREIFQNRLDKFIKELRVIQRILRVFSEVETGSVPDIELGSLSTTDPPIFLTNHPAVIASVALSVSWCLSQWKKFEEIRKIRAETAKLGTYSEKELDEFFDKKVKNQLDAAIDGHVKMRLNSSKLESTRKKELTSEFTWAVDALFARIERGLRIELKLPSPLSKIEEKLDISEEDEAALRAAAKQLNFPKMIGSPIRSLSSFPDTEDGSVKDTSEDGKH